MAIIRSHSMGSARKSAGLITYRNSRGRVIASQKRRAFTAAELAKIRKSSPAIVFKAASMFASAYRSLIVLAFDKTKYGSEVNAFVKVNYPVIASAIAYAVQDNLQLVSSPSKTWADVDNVNDFAMADVVAMVDNYTVDTDSYFVRSKLSGRAIVYVPKGSTFAATPMSADPAITAMSLVSTKGDTATTCTAVKVVGVNLSSSLTLQIGEAAQSGTWSDDNTTFTLATPFVWSDNKVFAVYTAEGALVYSKSFNGAIVPAPVVSSIAVNYTGNYDETINGITIAGSNLQEGMAVLIGGTQRSGTWSNDFKVFTLATAFTLGVDETTTIDVQFDGASLRSTTHSWNGGMG